MRESGHITEPKTVPSACSKRRGEHQPWSEPRESSDADVWERRREQETGSNGEQRTVSAS
jgi:hypothetical protein